MSPRLHVVLYEPEIPQNTGNIGRTCVAIGAKLWLVRPLGFRLDAAHLRRAGLDYWEHLEWEAVADWTALLERLGPRRRWLFTKQATRRHTEVHYAPDDVLVFGAESRGLPDSLLAASPDTRVRIPMTGPVRSLNLACAVAIGVYEALRQLEG